MKDIDLINKIYKISDKHNVILKGHIIISRNTNVILFAHYCKSTLFYKDFFMYKKAADFDVNVKIRGFYSFDFETAAVK